LYLLFSFLIQWLEAVTLVVHKENCGYNREKQVETLDYNRKKN